MSRAMKVGLGALLILGMAGGYWVYLWHEAALDQQAVESEPSDETLAEVRKVRDLLLATDIKDKALALGTLDKLDEPQRVEVLCVMAGDPSTIVRTVVAHLLGKYRDRSPKARATLVRMITSDPEKDVRDVARDALGAGGSP